MSNTEPAPSPEPQELSGPTPKPAATTLAQLVDAQVPPLRLARARERVRSINAVTRRHVVVLDDDPTGSQVVHNVPVLTRWDDSDLRWAFAHPARTFFILTNTRSLDADATESLLRELDSRIHRVAEELGTNVALLSRTDSTLRGHFPLETDVLRRGAVERDAPTTPSSWHLRTSTPAGSRSTTCTTSARAQSTCPSAKTVYAADEAFGYHSSSLTDWVEEKTGSDVRPPPVLSVSLTEIRSGGIASVTRLLLAARDGAVVVVNALDESDLEVVVLALVAAEATGWRAICRVGPSFVPVRAGIGRRAPLQPAEILRGPARRGHGLVVVGSHVELTTQQVEMLLAQRGITAVELDVSALLDSAGESAELDRCTEALVEAASRGDVVLMTSREQVVIEVGPSSLELARRVSTALVELSRQFVRPSTWPGWWPRAASPRTTSPPTACTCAGPPCWGSFPRGSSRSGVPRPARRPARARRAGRLPVRRLRRQRRRQDTLRDAVMTLRRTRHA